jgi:curved DNA-binding protein CbpA
VSHRRTYYELLEVLPSASQAEIRASYRRLARRWHPDTNAGSAEAEAEREFKRISRAYETLGDRGRRAAYDARHLGARFAGPGRGERPSFMVEDDRLYHSDLGHHSDFYQAGDPLNVADAATLTGRHPDVIRRAIRSRQLAASRHGHIYLLRRRDVERWDKATRRRQPDVGET